MCSHSLVKGAQAMSLVNILWAVVVILVILWLLGWLVGHIADPYPACDSGYCSVVQPLCGNAQRRRVGEVSHCS